MKKISSSFLLSLILALLVSTIFYLESISLNIIDVKSFTFYILNFILIFLIISIFEIVRGRNKDVQKESEIHALKANEKYRKEFIGDVSHELKTPIFNIQGYILTLLDGGIGDKNINQKYLKSTEKNINRLISIVEDLTTISKLEAHELELNCRKFDIIALLKEVLEIYELKAVESMIDFKVQAEKQEYFVYADKARITEVLSNLISNSIIYGKTGGTTEIRIKEIAEKTYIHIADNGIGISEEYTGRIFERFFRVDKSRSAKYGGTGLGLSIIKHIIDAHNQRIYVKSKLDTGTTFTFTLQKS